MAKRCSRANVLVDGRCIKRGHAKKEAKNWFNKMIIEGYSDTAAYNLVEKSYGYEIADEVFDEQR
jgi:hypothetical protein